MADDKKDPRSLLADAVKRRDELNTFIRVMQEMLGEPDGPGPQAAPKLPGQALHGAAPADPMAAVYPGMFFGKTKPQAVEMLLQHVGTKERPRPLKLTKILECLKVGGVEITDKKPLVNLWGTLSRNDKFIRAGKAGWGLAEWYDPGVIAKFRKEGGKASDDEAENGGN